MKKLALIAVASALALSAPAFAAETAPAHATVAAKVAAPAAKVVAVVKKDESAEKVSAAVVSLKKAQQDLTGSKDAHAVKALDLVNSALAELAPAPAAKK